MLVVNELGTRKVGIQNIFVSIVNTSSLTPFWKEKIWKKAETMKFLCMVFYALVCWKNIKLAIQHVWKKNLHKMAYLGWTFADSKAYAHGNGHIHGIIHDYLTKFGTTIGVTIVDNISIGICNYLVIKIKIFILQVLEMTFCEGTASNSFEICSISFLAKVGHIRWPLTMFQ